MITQQYIVRDVETKYYALADIFFLQINIIIEIDEPYHLSEQMMLSDSFYFLNGILNKSGTVTNS